MNINTITLEYMHLYSYSLAESKRMSLLSGSASTSGTKRILQIAGQFPF